MRNQQLHRARTARACPRASTACYRITISPGHGPASQQRRSPGVGVHLAPRSGPEGESTRALPWVPFLFTMGRGAGTAG